MGDAAMLVTSADASGWAAALERIAEDRETRDSLVARGTDRIAGRSWLSAAAAYLTLYEQARTGA